MGAYYAMLKPNPELGFQDYFDYYASDVCYRAFRHAAGKNATRYGIPLAIMMATAFGLVDEFHQSFVAFRHSNGLDLFADAVGATVAVLCWYSLQLPRQALQKPHEFGKGSFTPLNR